MNTGKYYRWHLFLKQPDYTKDPDFDKGLEIELSVEADRLELRIGGEVCNALAVRDFATMAREFCAVPEIKACYPVKQE